VATAPEAELTLRIGVDVVGVNRLERLVGNDERRQESLFTRRELDYCRGKRRCYEHMAARFAAKEAVLKAFGTGISQRMRWTDVEVVNAPGGRPVVNLAGAVASFAERHGLAELDVSLSHTEGMAIAQALTSWRGRPGESSPCAST
jgi:holo-[acyl-carrier protein] synthase